VISQCSVVKIITAENAEFAELFRFLGGL